MNDALTALAEGGWQVLAGPGLAFLVVGVLIGYVVGLIPGIGGPAAMALMLPSVFSLDITAACALLTGLAASTVTAGEITSILLGVPGEATTAAMLADGHRLMRRGQGGRAAGAAVVASLAGGAFGALVLALSIPVARPLLSSIGSPELLMLAVMGVMLAAPVSAQAPLKGVIAGGVGLALATVGLDPSEGTPRFTFGALFLWDGIGLLSVALGLFAIPEAVRLLTDREPAAVAAAAGGGAREGLRDAVRHWRLILRCSLIGTGVGVLPGVGATVSQWLAYGHAAQSSGRRAQFGTGEIEGVIGPGAASNATLGGDFVPTLALGIPGSLPTAIILGALVLKGVAPGPGLLQPEHDGGHLALVFSFVWMIVIGNALAAVISLLLLDRLSAIARLRPALLFPVVMAFVPLGIYAERQAAGDLIVTAMMGITGCVMARYEWPRAPLLLGLVLGPMLERRWLLSASAYGAAWAWRPGVILLAGLSVLLIVRMRPRGDGAASVPRRPAERGDVVVALSAGAAAAIALGVTRGLPATPAALPRSALSLVAALSAVQAWLLWRRSVPGQRSPQDGRRLVLAAASAAPFLLGPMVAGFALSTGVASGLYLRLVAAESWPRAALMSLALTMAVALLLSSAFPASHAVVWWGPWR